MKEALCKIRCPETPSLIAAHSCPGRATPSHVPFRPRLPRVASDLLGDLIPVGRACFRHYHCMLQTAGSGSCTLPRWRESHGVGDALTYSG